MWIKILSIISISFQFITFPLAAPEILGKEWLKKTEVLIRNSIKTIPFIVLFVLGIGIGLGFSFGVIKQNKLITIILVIVIIIMSLLRKKITLFLDSKIVLPILNKLIISDNLRFSLLKIAAFLFTIAFILQIIIIVYS